MGFFSNHEAEIEAERSREADRDELSLETEPIIFEMTSAGWRASKLTRRGWFESSARTIDDARAALAARIRLALAES
jgi:hypothetical protein